MRVSSRADSYEISQEDSKFLGILSLFAIETCKLTKEFPRINTLHSTFSIKLVFHFTFNYKRLFTTINMP